MIEEHDRTNRTNGSRGLKRWQVQKHYRGHAEPEDIERDEATWQRLAKRAQDTAQKKQDIEYAIDAKRQKGVGLRKALTKKQRQRKATEKDQMKLPINEQYSPEQERKFLNKKTHNLMISYSGEKIFQRQLIAFTILMT